MFIKGITGLVVCFLAVFFLAGCATLQDNGRDYNAETQKSLSVAAMLRFDDVPVPAGFKVIESESFAFQNEATRVALLKYAGAKIADQVVMFYKDEMPLYNWDPINVIEYERRMMNYEKGSESCIITVESESRKSIITIAISPKSRPMKVEKDK